VRVFPEKARDESASFDATGSRVVTATKDNMARVWALDGAGGATQVAELVGHTNWVWNAAFSPDGTRVATASRDGTARIWSLDPGRSGSAGAREVHLFAPHTGEVLSVAFSRRRAAGHRFRRRTPGVWTLGGSGPETILRHDDAVNDAAFSADGAWVVTASRDKTARIWNAATGVERLTLRHRHPVRSASFRPGRREPIQVATGSDDGKVRLWGISLSALVDYARYATTACLTVEDRVRFLAESRTEARHSFEQCERGNEREPPPE
jgi:WD40 repeat protein